MSTPVIPFGGQFIPQIYRGGYSGPDQRGQLKRDLEMYRSAGIKTVVLHGFPRELERNWDNLVRLCKSSGIYAFMASWGLDGTRDNDGTKLTAREKGECIGNVLSDSCDGGLLDAEGRWDLGGTDPEGCTEAGALELCKAMREKAPLALVGDQPWPWIEYHGSVRRSARPIDQGGVFAGFPVDEFAVGINWGRFRQNYWLNWQRPDAYQLVTSRMDREWDALDKVLAPIGLQHPNCVTVQMYKHDKRPWDLGHHLLDRMVSKQQPVIAWDHPKLDRSALRIWQAVNRLVELGIAFPGCDPVQSVKNYQFQFVRSSNPLTVDGLLGNHTIDRLLA